MSTAIYLSGNDSERLPCPYPPFDNEPCFLESKSSPAIPVFTYRSIPSPLVPSILGASSRGAAHPEASPPSSSDPDSGSESSDGFGYHEGYPSSPTSSSHVNHKNSFDFEFGRGHDVKSDFPSGFSTASTSPTSSHDHFQQLPVSLPIQAPEWMWIFSSLPNDDNEETEEFAEMVKEDSRRITCLKKFEGLKKQNHLANLRNEPLIPVPNNLGIIIPTDSCRPITSIAQIFNMPLTELDSWLSHYGLQSCAEVGSERMQRLTLAQHVGAVSPDEPFQPRRSS